MRICKSRILPVMLAGILQSSTALSQVENSGPLLSAAKDSLQAAVAAWNEDGMLKARARFQRLLGATEYIALTHYYIAYADYRLAAYHMEKNKQQAEDYIDDAIAHLEQSLSGDGKVVEAEAHALLGSCYGQKISLAPSQAMAYGLSAGQHAELSVSMAPDNPRVVMLHAVGKFFTPEMYGGSKLVALKELQHAAALFKTFTPAGALQPDWGAEEVFAWIGVVQMDLGNIGEARAAFDKALAINPGYPWVKQALLPQLAAMEKK